QRAVEGLVRLARRLPHRLHAEHRDRPGRRDGDRAPARARLRRARQRRRPLGARDRRARRDPPRPRRRRGPAPPAPPRRGLEEGARRGEARPVERGEREEGDGLLDEGRRSRRRRQDRDRAGRQAQPQPGRGRLGPRARPRLVRRLRSRQRPEDRLRRPRRARRPRRPRRCAGGDADRAWLFCKCRRSAGRKPGTAAARPFRRRRRRRRRRAGQRGQAVNGAALLRRLRDHFDWPLVLTILAIATIGVVNLFSATRAAPVHGLFEAHIRFLVVGLGLFFVASVIDYRVWQRFSWVVLFIGVAAVVGVHFVGVVVKGSRRWLGYGNLRLQPSEFVKIGVILALARFVHDREGDDLKLVGLATRFGAFVLTILMIAWQPDLGTAMLVALICLSVMLLAARRIWPSAVGLVAVAAAVACRWARAPQD